MKPTSLSKLAVAMSLAGALVLPGLAQARTLTLNTQMQNYSGRDAYLAYYITDVNGQYHSTLWVAGKKAKYYKHLRDWAQGGGSKPAEFDGLTGASVGSGETLEVAVELEDALIDAGYEIRIDSAVEDKRDNRGEIKLPLTQQATTVNGGAQGYVDSFSYHF